MSTLLCILVIVEIGVSVPISERHTVADLQSVPVRRKAMGGPRNLDPYRECEYYRIQPYLQVASDLQGMPAAQRLAKLSEWAAIESLSEPTRLLCHMLVEKEDGTPLRPPLQGGPLFVLEGKNEHFPMMPLFYFKGVPFYIAVGYQMAGRPEPAGEYLKYAFSVGRWRRIKYHTIDEKQLADIAEEFIEQYRTRAQFPRSFRQFILSQIGPPQPPRSQKTLSEKPVENKSAGRTVKD